MHSILGNLKHNSQIHKTYSRDWVIHVTSGNIRRGKVIKISHTNMLFDIFPGFNFGVDDRE